MSKEADEQAGPKYDRCASATGLLISIPAGAWRSLFWDTSMSNAIRIDEELRALIDPLSDDELDQLEANVLAEGIRDPVVVWDQENILLDGHHRVALSEKHGLEYDVSLVSLPDRRAAKLWMIRNQLGRRNLTREQESYFRGRLYNELKQGHGGDRRSNRHNDGLKSTADEVAESYGVTSRTVERDAKYTEAVDLLEKEGVPRQDLTGKSKRFTKKDAVEVASLPEKERKETLKLVREGEAKNVPKAKQKLKERRLKAKLKEQNTTAKEVAVIYPETCESFCKRAEKAGKADLLITDPPYKTEFKDQQAFEAFVSTWVIQAMTALKSSARAYVFVGAYPDELCLYLNTFQDFVSIVAPGWTIDNILPWTYRNTLGPAPKMGYKLNWQACIHLYGPDANSLNTPKMTEQFTVQDINAPDGRMGDRFHTFQKPDILAERLIRHSTKEGDLVIDPFAGTGTFPLAAARLGRTAFGSEPEEKMLGICKERGAKIGGEVSDA